MKKYEKPSLTILLLSGNETICGGCDVKLRDNEALNSQLAWLVEDTDGILTKAEASLIFGSGEGCTKEVADYCKFTSVMSNISWS